MNDARLEIRDLATQPRWPHERVQALAGRIRGNALRDWGVHVARRFGPDAPDTVRRRLGLDARDLPDRPTKKHWLPIWIQVRLPEVVVDEFLGGDFLGFEGLFDETTGAGDKVLRWVAAKLGPVAVLKRSGWYHSNVCDVGTCSPTVGDDSARLDFSDAEVFGNPTWRLLQLFGMRGMFRALNRSLDDAWGQDAGERGFALHMSWRHGNGQR